MKSAIVCLFPVALLGVLCLAMPAVAQPSVPAAAPYEEAIRGLDAFIAAEVESKQLPALSIALVDDQKVVWARGYGFADAAKKKRPPPRRSIASAASPSCSPTLP